MKRLPDFREEKRLWKKGYKVVIGVDEVGRGAFAGPVVAAAIAFSPEVNNGVKIDDSKRLTPQQRKIAAKWIKKNCLAYGVGEVNVATINRVGIGKATAQAMRRAIANLESKIKNRLEEYLLIDAFYVKYVKGIGLKNQKAIIKGDQKSISIAAASILAKVYRDTLMQKLALRYRKYQLGKNKGYGTRKHQELIKQNGITRLHRVVFVKNFC